MLKQSESPKAREIDMRNVGARTQISEPQLPPGVHKHTSPHHGWM